MTQPSDRREADFHDQWAASTGLEETNMVEAFENQTAPENRFILSLMGNLRGLRILDIGCGLGESSVYLARQGAVVTANDISPGMLDHTVRLGQTHQVTVSTLLGPLENIEVPHEAFDIVYAANVLHHAGSIDLMLRRIHEALVPGGRFFTWDPLAYNPVINVYRAIAPKVHTVDEHPLRFSILKKARSVFREVRHREFWLTSMAIFLKYFLIDRISPNSDRYWKRILTEKPENLRGWFTPLQRIDEYLLNLPPFRFMAWNMVMWGLK